MYFLRLVSLVFSVFWMVGNVRTDVSVEEKTAEMWKTISGIEEMETKKLDPIDFKENDRELQYSIDIPIIQLVSQNSCKKLILFLTT